MVKLTQPQIGGVQAQMTDLLSKYSPPISILLLLTVFMGVVFLPKLPEMLMDHSDTVYGRAIHLALVYHITNTFGWSFGILVALFSALLIGAGSKRRLPVKEGFNSDITIVEQNKKWFVEKVLGENPFLIEEENVLTLPVQDMDRRGTGSYGGSVQNTSVSM